MKTWLSFMFGSNVALRVALGIALGGAAGCGGDGGDVEGTCSSAAAALCAAACDCGGSAGCSIGDADGSITFDSEADCRSLYAFACGQPSGGQDYAACETALQTPTCVPSSDGMALMVPPACEEDE